MKHHFCEEGCSTTARMIIKKIPAVWKTNGGVVDPGAVQQETIMFCFACVEPKGRKQPQNWSDSGQNSQGDQRTTITVCGQLLKHGFNSCIARKTPLIIEKQRRERYLWGEKHHHWTQAHWTKILWSDESSFQLYPIRANVRVWKRCGEYVSAYTVATVKHEGGSIMVSGYMSAGGVGQLTVCEGTINPPKYCQILKHHMLPPARALFNRRCAQHWIFQQDNVLCHTARVSKTWLNKHGVQLLD